jgi:peroxiredoxin
MAPDFTLNSLDGEDISLSQYFGKENVFLVFGASWCPYCVKEIPELNEIEARYGGQGLKLLYINVQESREKVASFAQKNSMGYTVLPDTSGAVARLYRVRGIPHQVIIDKKGEILYEGPRPGQGLVYLIKETLGI